LIVIDASVAVKWFLPEIDSAAARALYGEEMSAPAIWLSEVANALWHHVRVGELEEEQAHTLLVRFSKSPMISTPIEREIEKAFALANALPHPVYDCLYLALAIHENTILITADSRFARAVRRHGQWTRYVRVLSEN
jgi:predicted nucleic acid-binding protein